MYRKPMSRKMSLPEVAVIGVLAASMFWFNSCAVHTAPQVTPVASENHAPSFALPDQHGEIVSLTDLTANGPALVVFYRGHW